MRFEFTRCGNSNASCNSSRFSILSINALDFLTSSSSSLPFTYTLSSRIRKLADELHSHKSHSLMRCSVSIFFHLSIFKAPPQMWYVWKRRNLSIFRATLGNSKISLAARTSRLFSSSNQAGSWIMILPNDDRCLCILKLFNQISDLKKSGNFSNSTPSRSSVLRSSKLFQYCRFVEILMMRRVRSLQALTRKIERRCLF